MRRSRTDCEDSAVLRGVSLKGIINKMTQVSKNSEKPIVHFLLMGGLADISFNPALPEGLRFVDEGSGVEIRITPAKPESDPFRPLICRAYVSLPTSRSAHKFIASLIARNFEKYDGMLITLPYSRRDQMLIDANGAISEGFGVPFELYPPEVQALCDTAKGLLSGVAERFARLLRWQQNLDGPHWVFASEPPLYWKTEGESYYIVGLRAQGGISNSPAGIEWKDEDRADLEGVWGDASAEEGIAHELLREAKVLQENSPRSAFLIAAAALEIGVKTYVGHVSPDTRWLMSELPSPPIHKILRSYIPELQKSHGRPLDYWDKLKPVFRRVEGYATTRNKLVHTGTIKITPEDLNSCLQDVSDLLYLFDVMRGYEWAKHNLSHTMLSTLGWPSSRRTRFIVQMLVNRL
jgi:hypothetical protein